MTPELMKQYLQVLKDANVMQGIMKVDGFEMSVQFGVDMPDEAVEVPQGAGGWKQREAEKKWQDSPKGLDLPFIEEETE